MNRMRRLIRQAALFALLLALLLAPGFTAHAKGKGFKDVVKHLEKNYQAKKTKIPMLGLANFAIKLVRPAGVKGFKLAVYEDQDFSAREGSPSFDAVLRDAYNKDWQPLISLNSRREGNTRTYIYAKYSGKDAQFAVLTMQEREAVMLEVKFNPDAAARFLENPKIMGISLGNSVRGNNSGTVAGVGTIRNRNGGGAKGAVIVNGQPVDTTPGIPDPAGTASGTTPDNNASSANVGNGQPVARPALNGAANDENNPPAPSTDAKLSPPKEDTIRIETRLINLNVKATDRAGQPITNLKPEDFSIYEDGVKQQVSHFKPVNAPVSLILLMDLSGSTKQKRDGMITAAKRFIDALPAQDRISLVAFTRRYTQLADFSTDKVALKKAVEKIKKIDGGTAFYDATWQALDQLRQIPDARKAIVVLTDGEDESLISNRDTKYNFDELLGRASEEDVTIYPIYFKAGQHLNKLNVLFGNGSLLGVNDKVKTARNQLDELAAQTGGEVFSAQREGQLEEAYQRVASELHTLYSLAYAPDKLKHNGEFRKISIKLERPDAVAKTRKGYFDK